MANIYLSYAQEKNLFEQFIYELNVLGLLLSFQGICYHTLLS